MKRKERLGIFSFEDKEGIVDEYVLFLLENMNKQLTRLWIVYRGKLTDESRKQLELYSDRLLYSDEETHAGAYRDAILAQGGEIDQYDELVLFDNTFYGPLDTFEPVFEKMDRLGPDFWGITGCQEKLYKNGAGEKRYIAERLETYFMVFGKKMLCDRPFYVFWEEVIKENGLDDAGLEENLTEYFVKRGYKWDTYIHSAELNVRKEYGISHSTYLPDYLLQNKKMPVLPEKIFELPYSEVIAGMGGETLANCMSYIRNETGYRTEMIWDHLLRTSHIADLKQKLHLNYILPTDTVLGNCVKMPKVAVIIHSYYADLIDDVCHYAEQVPWFADLYITTGSPDKKKLIEKKCRNLKCRKFEVRLVENRGRDLAALLVGTRDIVPKYEYVCFTHDKKTSGNIGPVPIGKSFFYTAIENVLSSTAYIENIIDTFEENEKLGILSPPGPVHNIYFGSIGREWTACFEETEKLLKEFQVNVPLSKEKQPFVLGTSLWFRTKALEKLFAKEWKNEDFPPEPLGSDGTVSHALERSFPYFAQEKGYYAGWVMTQDYASLEVANLRYLLSETIMVQQRKNEPYVEQYFKKFIADQKNACNCVGTLYFDYGEGFCQEDTQIVYYHMDEDNKFEFTSVIESEEKLYRLRFDPLEKRKTLISISGAWFGKNELSVELHNGIEIGGGVQLFDETDPYYIFDVRNLEGSVLKIKGSVSFVEEHVVKRILECMNFSLTGFFWDDGNGYSEARCIRKQATIDHDGNFYVRYHLKNSVSARAIRFDPVEKADSLVKLEKVMCNGNELSGCTHNGCEVGQDMILFETDDPCFAWNGRFSDLQVVEIWGKMSFLPKEVVEIVKKGNGAY